MCWLEAFVRACALGTASAPEPCNACVVFCCVKQLCCLRLGRKHSRQSRQLLVQLLRQPLAWKAPQRILWKLLILPRSRFSRCAAPRCNIKKRKVYTALCAIKRASEPKKQQPGLAKSVRFATSKCLVVFNQSDTMFVCNVACCVTGCSPH